MATPTIRALGERYPEASIDALCSAGAAPLLELHPHVERTLSLKWRNVPFALSIEKRRLARELRDRNYTFAVLLERAPRYRELLERAGIAEIRSFDETPFDPGTHAIVNNMRAAGVDGPTDMELIVSDEDERKAHELLSDLRAPLVGIHAGYGPRAKKRDQSERLKGWALDNFVDVGKRLADEGASIVLTGSKDDRPDVDAMAKRMPARVLAGRTSARELGAVIRRLDVLVSVDSGPAHMAAAVGTPLVVLWGPAILEQVRPMSSRSSVNVLRHPVPCAPCYDTPLMKTCQRNVCMEGITPEDVLEAARPFLSS